MQKIIFLLIVTLGFAGCKKALNVKEDMYFEQVNWINPGIHPLIDNNSEYGVAPMHLELRADGFAGLYPGSGDIVGRGTYQVKGKKVKVKISDFGNITYEFKIKSPTELIGSGGELLHLKE